LRRTREDAGGPLPSVAGRKLRLANEVQAEEVKESQARARDGHPEGRGRGVAPSHRHPEPGRTGRLGIQPSAAIALGTMLYMGRYSVLRVNLYGTFTEPARDASARRAPRGGARANGWGKGVWGEGEGPSQVHPEDGGIDRGWGSCAILYT
jgi:hypothetical protein